MAAKPRIITATFAHETSTFTPVQTTWANYREQRMGYLQGAEILEKFAGTGTAIGGFIQGAEKHGFELISTVFANAHPSAPTPRPIFDEILGDILAAIEAAGEIDGVLLELHGSMVAEGIGDGDGHILGAIRQLVGPDVAILAQLDIHSNMSHAMVELADVLIGRETYPEIDQVERSIECTDVLERILRHGLKPTMALHQIPLMWGTNQVTAHSPMREAIAELHRIEALPGVICGSLATCFPLADVPEMGASVYVATDDDPELAQRCADELAAWVWERRAQWHSPRPTTKEALQVAQQEGKYPVIFADAWDNTGGGSPGDSTGMLRTFIEAGLQDACVLYTVDPEAVDQCREAGVGATLELAVGGKSSPMQGKPVSMRAEVVAFSEEGRFFYSGPRNHGLEKVMGPSAHIRQDGVHVLLVTEREQPFDTAFAMSMGLEPRQMSYIGIKSAAHFRAGFEEFAGAIYNVSEPSAQNPESGHVRFQNLGRKVYPLDEI
jgi:microcystin degradation protein MlrC